jgi:hypothetical protein
MFAEAGLHSGPDQLDIVIAQDDIDMVSGGNETSESGEYLVVAACHAIQPGDAGFDGRRAGSGLFIKLYLQEVEEVAQDDQAPRARGIAAALDEMVEEPTEGAIEEEILVAIERASAGIVASGHVHVAHDDNVAIVDRWHGQRLVTEG